MLCVPIYNMKLAMMQKTPIFTRFSGHTADKRGQNEVFARNITVHYINPKKLQYDKVTLQKTKNYSNYITVTVTQVLPEVSPPQKQQPSR